ncbi:helicase [Sinorhizobium meliloti]|uniref:helicase n=1 Tax=Rhizobium meliloti TaxID=382 RepID=UPI000FD83B3C|nr:helicase [Sinorhizobium meliloti]RVE88638.1 helicase [Sinorhizobium meliloti]RVH41852.1 helicase [Sinorhizobium meliloti]RVK12897.1 helicase [Sinorhizobium meliloti]
MRKYLATALLISVAMGPASALDIGAGVTVSGTHVGAGVSAGTKGASAGVGTSVGGVGGTNTGASVGTNAGTSVGALGNVGGASAGISSSSGSGAGWSSRGGAGTGTGNVSVRSAAGAGSPGRGGANAIAGVAPAKRTPKTIVLPRIIWPLKARRTENGRGEWWYPSPLPIPLAVIPGTPRAVVRVCRQAIASAAFPLGALRVSAASAGRLLRDRGGTLTAPLAVRIDYAGQGGSEIRQARIRCRLNASGMVIAVI